MKLLELVMIVRNSGEVLRRCLKENKKYIDKWTIVDTGSIDNTKEIIKEELKEIEGEIYDIEFVDFSQSRNKSIELSKKECKYIIVMDDSYILHGGKKLRELLSREKSKYLSIRIGKYNEEINNIQNEYYSNRIIRSNNNTIRYINRVHECLDIKDNNVKVIAEEEIFIEDVDSEEHKRRSINRYKKDVEMLEKDLEEDPKSARTIYYLAKTHYNLENNEKALKYFKRLNEVVKDNEEYSFEANYNIANINFLLSNNDKNFERELEKISKKYKKRLESMYKLAIIYKEREEIYKADVIMSFLINKSSRKPMLKNTILEHDIYEYFIPYLYMEIKLKLGEYEKILEILNNMLKMYPNNQPLLNIKYELSSKKKISSVVLSLKTFVIHTGGQQAIFKNWDPRGDNRISGSEYMAVNLGNEMVKRGYRVIIIGSFEENSLGIDNQCIVNGVEYIDYKYFCEFALKYVIDFLIVSRYTENLMYYENIKKVYLWCHDVLPILNESKCFQVHKEKFKGLISVSKWQKNNIITKLNISGDNIIESRNAIYSERFINKEIKKVGYRFIYTSDPSRGLDKLIEIIEMVKEKYQELSLYIFANKENINYETLKRIDKINENENYIFIKNRINQEELAIEFLKSDVWFYPTDFKETYCISAVEAMCAKCLVVTVKLGALTEIVEGKGILCDYPISNNKLLRKLFFVLDNKQLKDHLIEKAYDWGIKQTFSDLSKEWDSFLQK
jgi:tetratricopeptide (TPR) repeat protein